MSTPLETLPEDLLIAGQKPLRRLRLGLSARATIIAGF